MVEWDHREERLEIQLVGRRGGSTKTYGEVHSGPRQGTKGLARFGASSSSTKAEVLESTRTHPPTPERVNVEAKVWGEVLNAKDGSKFDAEEVLPGIL